MLTFQLPAAETATRMPVETRPKPTADWLERLPFANPVDVAQQLVTALYALNRRELTASLRDELMALYRPTIARAASSLASGLAAAGVPPLEQQRHTGAVLRELLNEHSIAYKHLLVAAQTQRGRQATKRLGEISALLLAALAEIQAVCYLTYSPSPEGLWLEMHSLYPAALKSGNTDGTMADAPPASLTYSHTLLLALADPPHMSREEFAHTRLYLGWLGGRAAIGPVPQNRMDGGFIVRPSLDQGPSARPMAPQPGDLWLDTEGVCRQLHAAVSRLRSGETPRRIGLPADMDVELSQTLGKHLLKLWRVGMQRAFKRYPAPGSAVQAVAGVGAIHRLLEQLPAAAHDSSADSSVVIGDVGTFAAAPGTAVHTSHWTVSNDSARGLALTGAPDLPLNLKVGDALALRGEDKENWSLAVIRWIRTGAARQVELGIERLAPQVLPVWVRPLRGQRKARPEPALLLPGLAALQQPDRLLLPRYVYQSGMDAEMRQASKHSTLSFGHRLEYTTSFDLIEFTLAEASS